MFDGFSDKDMATLQFLMSAPMNVIDEWYRHASEDEMKYADTLFECGRIRVIDLVVEKLGRSGVQEAAMILDDIFHKS